MSISLIENLIILLKRQIFENDKNKNDKKIMVYEENDKIIRD